MDLKEGVRWFRVAADQGHARAQCTLGFCYKTGKGVAPDQQESQRWYRLAAAQGHAEAQAALSSWSRR